MHDLENRAALPDALSVLARELPRPEWEGHPNFDGLTRFWLERHLMFRKLLEHLQTESRAFVVGDREAMEHGRRTHRYAGALLNELHGHHMIEDMQYFPVLARLEPRLQTGFDLLDRDHKALDGHLHALADSTNALLRRVGDADARDRGGELLAELDRFAPFMDRHLEDEEDLVVPVILKNGARL